ncbi:GntR family transcriptional regulator [Paenibacillus sp. J5C_2022]|uniref:GntR family transcriptional regulator n=1 Tax=Paenibacillus sp. J5C2022 TaxID=2977129 RepID=UPI0021CFA45E|nr:GntR family transcriptional regulator [Paenibacillus sp. J5C2022]MCU6708664.1 GntR family transcriptional regulator [Paenibacillus sp. J5C2022]
MTKRTGNSLYFNIQEQLLKQIESGVYKVGERLPTEAELCQIFSASRTTIRLALSELEVQGIVERIQGKGTFVKRKELQLIHTRSFTEDVLMQGKEPTSQIVEAKVVPAEMPLHEFLQAPLHAPINELLRVRYADNEPLIYERTYIPWNLAPGLVNDYKEGSLFTFLETKYQLKPKRSVEQLKPILADKTANKLLGIKEGSPCLQVKSFTYLTDDTPLEYSFGVFRGDFSSYTIERHF